jgi:undecaprenyl-diphosphatase
LVGASLRPARGGFKAHSWRGSANASTLDLVDYEIFEAINGLAARNDVFEDWLRFFSIYAELIFGVFLAVAFLARGRWRSVNARHGVVAAALASIVALEVAQVIAGVWDRPRPYEGHLETHVFVATSSDPSFPSDHATVAFAIAVSILLRNKRLGLITIAMAMVVALSRVVVGVHYPSDVVAGAGLGTLAALLLWSPPIRDPLRRVSQRLSALYDRLAARLLARLAPNN